MEGNSVGFSSLEPSSRRIVMDHPNRVLSYRKPPLHAASKRARESCSNLRQTTSASVSFIKNSIAMQTWWALGTRENGEVIDASSY
jgi:hypothetical protein